MTEIDALHCDVIVSGWKQLTGQKAEEAAEQTEAPMPRGEKLFKFLACLMLRDFYGTVIIGFESGEVTHVETETRGTWQYNELPVETKEGPEVPNNR